MDEATADLARSFFEDVWNARDADAVPKFARTYGTSHQVGSEVTNLAEFVGRVHRPFRDAFPDLRITVENVVAARDQAVVHWRARGTHLGGGLGLSASGRRVDFLGMTWLVFRDGKITRAQDLWDRGGLIQKLSAAAD